MLLVADCVTLSHHRCVALDSFTEVLAQKLLPAWDIRVSNYRQQFQRAEH